MCSRSVVSAVGVFVAALLFSPAWAETATPKFTADHAHHQTSSPTGRTRSTVAYVQAMQTMHRSMAVPLSGNVDIDFVRQMIPHHQAAVDMAKIELRYGHDERLKQFNRWIISAQEQEIGYMQQWLRRRDRGAVIPHAQDYYGASMKRMHAEMMIDYSGDADIDFVRGMIPHHQGAVDMASILLSSGNDPELHELAENIYNSQTYEIAWMQRWLVAHKGM